MDTLLAVNESDISFEILFHQGPQPMWIVDALTFRFLLVNQAAITHYGYSYKEFLSISLEQVRPADELQSMKSLIRRIKHNQTIKKNIRHIKKNGDIIYVQITSYNVIYHDRECRMVIINDVTQALRKDLEIKNVLKRLYQTLDSITDGFITITKTGKITYWNKEAEKFFGLTRGHKHNGAILKAQIGGTGIVAVRKLKTAIDTGQTKKFEVFLPVLKKWLNVSVYPDKTGLTVYFQDITDNKSNRAQITEKDKHLKEIAFINSHMVRKHLANIIGIVNAVDDDLETCDDLISPMRMLKASAEELDKVVMLLNLQTDTEIK